MTTVVDVKVIVTARWTVGGFLKNFGIRQLIHSLGSLYNGNALEVQLVNTQEVPEPMDTPIRSDRVIRCKAKYKILVENDLAEVQYEGKHQMVIENFELCGILVKNMESKEMYLTNIVVVLGKKQPVKIKCASWIQPSNNYFEIRLFFTDKSYLPSDTPFGLRRWRARELENLRGGELNTGERKVTDRIYDYDVYNDLGDPDKEGLDRPVLGGEKLPYPRRCRTGRPLYEPERESETRNVRGFYVPRDEAFKDRKQKAFTMDIIRGVLDTLIPTIEDIGEDRNNGFSNFQHINNLLHDRTGNASMLKEFIELLPNIIFHSGRFLRFPAPEVLERDQFGWFRDEEFSRETLAGSNPCSIKLVKEWPLMSTLDPEVYGPPESAITSELVEGQIGGIFSLSEALQQKKLFMLDYHDLLLPYVNKVREIEDTTLYGSRTVFFLTPQETLRPIAIELTRPPTEDGRPQWKQVFTPDSFDATGSWLWRIAKVHVLAHDFAHHQVVSHWLRTHCCVEPYIIATKRQLSAVHPIYRLLNPYFRYTMEMNSLARESLINAGGIIETTFSTQKYSMELGSVVYDKEWKFDKQGLPADLINRGMAFEDPNSPHGLKFTIKDYPYANDGLLLWDAIKQWVTEYVKHYYMTEQLITSDQELGKWWSEIKEKGHEDKKDGWPELETPEDLIGILTTMIWITSGHHAAVNFGQYLYGGYFPNRPTIARIKMPSEEPSDEESKKFLKNPCSLLLDTFPSQLQGTTVMMVLSVLSSHSTDEQYIGHHAEPSWAHEPAIQRAFEIFSRTLRDIQTTIGDRNDDTRLKNRNGAGIIPYELLKPSSVESGVTDKGVPNSISI